MTRPPAAATVSVPHPRTAVWPIRSALGNATALFVTVLVFYWPALSAGYIWDDSGHLTAPDLQTWSGLARIWFEPGTTQQYYPLLHSAFWLEHRLWGDAAAGYHFINILWHAVSAVLFGLLLRRLQLPGAWLAAMLFAVHPVCVESVAWISEQKNTLSTVLYLAAALAWLRFEDDRRPICYAAATLCFAAALLTKTVTATLPAALLVVAWWRRGRLSWRGEVRPLLPWLLLGIAGGVGTAWMEATHIGASGGDFALGAVERVLLAGRVVWFYLSKLVWPAGLTFFYPRWTIDAGELWQWLFPVAALGALGLAAWWSRRDRGPLAMLLLFGGTLVPVLGFVNVYPFVFSYVADHFQYLACLSVIASVAAVAVRGYERLRLPGWSGPAAAAGLVVLLGGLTWRQCGMYHDVFTLWNTTLARNPSSWAANLNLGTALADAGRPSEGLPHLRRALELKPRTPEILNSLADVLNRLNRPSEALPFVEQALQVQPGFAEAHNTHGVAMMALGRAPEGIAAFERAVELAPWRTSMRVNLAWALANTGRLPEALAHFEQAGRQEPDSADVALKWGLALAMHRRSSEALPHLRRAVELLPGDPTSRFAYGNVLLDLGRWMEATREFETALRLDPGFEPARQVLDQLRPDR
ncbi:MAG: tetratricopeptide repeat protein [Opitutaceae bacterium]|nr:tetratricopeptide repeat protein [Opitutaceae bacterium]